MAAKKHRLAHQSIVDYASALTSLARTLPPGTTIGAIGASQAEAYLGELAERGLSPATLNFHRRHLKSAWSWFITRGLVDSNPWAKVEAFKADPKTPPLVPPEQVPAFLAACSDDFRPMAAVAVFAGLRRREVIELTWFDVDLRRGTILVQRSKSHRPRKIPIHQDLMAILSKLPKTSEYVFPSTNGGPRYMNDTWLNRSAKQAAYKAGIKTRVTFHGLRATCATLLAAAGAGDTAIRDILGHHDTSVTKVYFGLGVEDLRSVMSRVSVERLTGRNEEGVGAISAPTPAPTT